MVRKVKEQKLRKAVMSLTLKAESEDLNINVPKLGFTFLVQSWEMNIACRTKEMKKFVVLEIKMIEKVKIGEGREAQVPIIFPSFGSKKRVNGKNGSDMRPTNKTFVF
ncbi:hypothetical protein MTR_7g026750 [Medicago truncatula]|uniref:Uncharacterized protein n=1 Tax=Medicago truncatula TaxID=3880 RepID=G7L126_MEDTR|nr:hypothetical protein MTR_7g026750 [Medicago truncatula]